NGTSLLSVIVGMSAITKATGGELPRDADAALRQLYTHHARALHSYVERFCPDRASADDIVQETFIRAWRHLQQLSDDDRAARVRPMTVQTPWAEDSCDEPRAEDARDDSGLDQVLDRELVSAALQHLSP